MEFNKVIAVSGKPGLFEILSQTKTRIIVRSISDGKRFPITDTQNVSLLENIAIYTNKTEVPLLEVFRAMADKTNGKEAISHKASANKLESFFTEVLPEYDTERVYTSNIKKIIQWFNYLVRASFDFSKLVETTISQ